MKVFVSTIISTDSADVQLFASADVIASRRDKSLLETGALQQAIFNSVNFSCIVTDAQGSIQLFSIGAERMLGYRAADVIDKCSLADISDPQELIARAVTLNLELGKSTTPAFEALVSKASRGIDEIYELSYSRKDGRRFRAVTSLTVLRDTQNDVIGYLFIATDNTARKQVEDEKELHPRIRGQTDVIVGSDTHAPPLMTSNNHEQMLEGKSAHREMAEMQLGILNALPANIALLDSTGMILTVNQAWRLFASANVLQSSEFCIGQNYINICETATGACSDESATVAQGIRDVLSGSKAMFSIEYPCHSPDEKRWFRLVVIPVTDHLGSGAVVMHENVTERWHAKEAILRLNTELEDRVNRRTRQLEATNKQLEAFSYSVSHDLRSPLSTINGFSQLLLKLDGDHVSDKGKHYLRRIRAGVVNMGELIDGLMSLAKLSRGIPNRQEVDLTAMSLSLVQELRDSEPDRVVDVVIQSNLTSNGDPAMVTVVMQNLIANAWKYSSKASHALIEIGSETTEDGVTCIFVRDNGAGFDMAYAGKLFDVYQRLHKNTEYPGTGIGLANVKRAVELHCGRIWAQAAVGAGATFRFTLDTAQ